MSTIKPFENAGKYTVFHNHILDFVLPRCKPNTWKLISVIIRQTRGWNKDEDLLSFTQLEEKTGMGRNTLAAAIADGLEQRYIVRQPDGQSFRYALNTEFELDTSSKIEPVRKSNQFENRTSTSSKIAPELVRKSNTQRTIKQGTTTTANAVVTPTPAPVDVSAETVKTPTAQQLMIAALSEVTRLDLKIASHSGRLGKRARDLVEAGHTPERVREIYCRGGWWYQRDWRGQRGDPPTPEQVLETILRADDPTPATARPNGRPLTRNERNHAIIDQYIREHGLEEA